MHIPSEGMSESDKVTIVGEKHNVERCVVYVQKLLSGASDRAHRTYLKLALVPIYVWVHSLPLWITNLGCWG